MKRIDKKWLKTKREKSDFRELSNMKKKEIKTLKGIPFHKENGIYTDNLVIERRQRYIVIEDYYNNPELYDTDVNRLINELKYIITEERLLETMVEYKFKKKNKPQSMSFIHFIFNLILWRPLIACNKSVANKVFMDSVFNNKKYIKFLNEQIIEPLKPSTTVNELSYLLSRVYDDYIHICEEIGLLLGISHSFYDIMQECEHDANIDDIIFNTTLNDKDFQLSEAEQYMKDRTNTLRELLLESPRDNCMKPLLRAQEAVDPKQTREYLVHGGYKPSLEGYTVPFTVDTNLVNKGYYNVKSYILDALGGRKAAVLALKIGDSGYFSRQLTKLCSSIYLHDDPEEDCGSTHYYVTTIKDQEQLEDMRGRWYVVEDEGEPFLRQLIDTDYHVIGKTLKFRTIVTCASKHGICKTCYGNLFNMNYNKNVGILTALIMSEKYYQQNMSRICAPSGLKSSDVKSI